jgi:hypothetical protein
MKNVDIEAIYKNLGEFIVSFQWLENRFREIGWLILDPKRKNWPPKTLRTESFSKLINKVQKLYLELIDSIAPEDVEERKQTFKEIVKKTLALREYRNKLIHSAYIELKTSGQLFGLIRSNPRLKEDPLSGELLWDQEGLTKKSFEHGMTQMAEIAWQLNLHYIQLIHWAPFDKTKGLRE